MENSNNNDIKEDDVSTTFKIAMFLGGLVLGTAIVIIINIIRL
jgi:hypothetical protein